MVLVEASQAGFFDGNDEPVDVGEDGQQGEQGPWLVVGPTARKPAARVIPTVTPSRPSGAVRLKAAVGVTWCRGTESS